MAQGASWSTLPQFDINDPLTYYKMQQIVANMEWLKAHRITKTIVNASSDISFTSTSFAEIDDTLLEIELDTYGGSFFFGLNVCGKAANNNRTVFWDVLIDGYLWASTNGNTPATNGLGAIIHSDTDYSHLHPGSAVWTTEFVLNAGIHTFAPRLRLNSSSTLTIPVSNTAIQFWAEEC